MMAWSRLDIRIISLLGWLVFTLCTTSANADHSWGGYHWARTSHPFTLKLGNNVSSAWYSYLVTASADWTDSSVLNTTIVAGSTTPRSCRPTNGQVEVCNSKYGNTGWLGLAQIWVSGSHITQGTVKVNDTYFATPTYNTPAWRLMVMCQEVAHTFGLDHQDEHFDGANLGTCMDYTSDPDGPPSNEHPDQHDYAELEAIYNHLDSKTTINASVSNKMPPAMTDMDFATRGQWGKLVSSRHRGKVEVYELDFSQGHRVITFVIWAE